MGKVITLPPPAPIDAAKQAEDLLRDAWMACAPKSANALCDCVNACIAAACFAMLLPEAPDVMVESHVALAEFAIRNLSATLTVWCLDIESRAVPEAAETLQKLIAQRDEYEQALPGMAPPSEYALRDQGEWHAQLKRKARV